MQIRILQDTVESCAFEVPCGGACGRIDPKKARTPEPMEILSVHGVSPAADRWGNSVSFIYSVYDTFGLRSHRTWIRLRPEWTEAPFSL